MASSRKDQPHVLSLLPDPGHRPDGSQRAQPGPEPTHTKPNMKNESLPIGEGGRGGPGGHPPGGHPALPGSFPYALHPTA
jgi:hypothetical protein